MWDCYSLKCKLIFGLYYNPLVWKYQHRVYTCLRKQVKDSETAKDLCQETFLKAFIGINTFRGKSTFYSWIYRIAQNVCIDFLHKQKVEHDLVPLHTVDEHCITDRHPDPCDTLQR